MKYSQKMRLKRLVSAVLAASMAASVFIAVPVYADTESTTYTYDGYKVDYTVTNEWFGNQNVNVTLTNTSNESILNWALGYDATGEISGIWNGYVYSKSDENYIIKNSGYNYEIEPYQSVNFGYTLSGDELEAPENFQLCSKRVDKTEGYDVKLNVTGDWGDGFQAELIVTNTSDAPLEAWKVDFDSNFEIGNLWNGKIIESNDDGYSIASCMWTNPIACGESTSIGFTASKETSETPAVSNIKLSEVIIDRSGSVPSDNPVEPSEDELNITADAQYIENDGTAVISWNTNVNNGTFEVMYSEDNIEYIQIASVSDAKTYTYALGDIYGTVYFKVRQTTEGGQVAESSAVSVDIPVPVVPEKPVVDVSAEYDPETGYIVVSWETSVDGGTFDIYVSVDGGDFSKIGSVSDTTAFSFVPEVSGSYDIRIVQTTAVGMTGESSVVNVVCTIPDPAEDIDWEDETDSDEDGISNVYETYIYFTDPHNPDTDSDGLPDGYEVFTLDTDPLSSDTDENGVSDGDEDIDGDGLNNLREFELGTDPRDVDSDDDGLSDADEINIYGTDPLKYDTDEDNVSDGDEITLGLDPNSAATDGIPDNERTFEQFIPADDWLFYNINVDSSPVDVSIELDAAGVAINNIEASFSGYSYSMHNDAIVGVAPEFSYNENLKINDVKINFDLDNSIVNDYNSMYNDVSDEFVGIKRFNVFRYFEDTNMLLPIETFHDVPNNRVYAHYNEMGTYCLIDMTKWLDSLGYMNNSNQSAMTFAMERTAEAAESNSIDIVFLMYAQPAQTGFIKEELINTVNTVYDNADDVHMYFMINDGANVIPYMTSGRDYAQTKAEALAITNRLAFPVSNSVYLYKGFKAVSELTLRDGAQKHLFLIDGVFEPKTDTENVYLNRILEKNVNFGIVCDIVNSNLEYYRSISNGNVKNRHSIFSSFITDQISFPIDTGKDYIITSNGLTAIPDNFGAISVYSTQDYDGDGLSDVTEINFNVTDKNGQKLVTINADNSVTLPSFNECTAVEGTYVEEGLKRFYNEADNSVLEHLDEIKVLPLSSDPTAPDGDVDGILDKTEYDIIKKYNSKAEISVMAAKANSDGKVDSEISDCKLNLLSSNTIVDYGFNTKIRAESGEAVDSYIINGTGSIKSGYTLARYYGIKENATDSVKYGYLGNEYNTFYLEAYCDYDNTNKKWNNHLCINANLMFNQDELKLKAGSVRKVTSDEIISKIKEEWGINIQGNEYDFLGMDVKVSVSINKIIKTDNSSELQRLIQPPHKSEYRKDDRTYTGTYATYNLIDGKGKIETKSIGFTTLPQVYIFNDKAGGCMQDSKHTFSSCAHEFGHVLGLMDAYGDCGNEENYYMEPVPYETISEISFVPGADVGSDGSGEMMHRSGEVSANDIEMVIYARRDKELQFFVPIGRTIGDDNTETRYKLSPAIRDTYFYKCRKENFVKNLKVKKDHIYCFNGTTYVEVSADNSQKNTIMESLGERFNEDYYNYVLNLIKA